MKVYFLEIGWSYEIFNTLWFMSMWVTPTPSMSVEQRLSEHHVLNSDYCTKSRCHNYKLNIKQLNNMPCEQLVNWPSVIWTSGYWTLAHLNFQSIEHLSIEQFANWTILQLNIEHWSIEQIKILLMLNLQLFIWLVFNWPEFNHKIICGLDQDMNIV